VPAPAGDEARPLVSSAADLASPAIDPNNPNIPTFQLGGKLVKLSPPPPPPPPPFDFVAPPPSPMARQIIEVPKLVVKLLFSMEYKMVAFNDDKQKNFISTTLKWLKAKCVQPRQILSLNITDIYSGGWRRARLPAVRSMLRATPGLQAPELLAGLEARRALRQQCSACCARLQARQVLAHGSSRQTPPARLTAAGSTVMVVSTLFKPDTSMEAVGAFSNYLMSAEPAEHWYNEGLERDWGALLHAETLITSGEGRRAARGGLAREHAGCARRPGPGAGQRALAPALPGAAGRAQAE
jgi:hypothetical protein